MRQTGILAGAAAYALSHHFELLPRVHELARVLEQGLRDLGFEISCPVETCMVEVPPVWMSILILIFRRFRRSSMTPLRLV